MLDLLRPEHAYFFGFAQADGSLTRYAGRKGRLSIELGLRDMELLERLAEVVPCRATLRTRTRDTNFKRGHAAAVLDVHDAAFR